MGHTQTAEKEHSHGFYDTLIALDRYNPIWEQMKVQMRIKYLNELRKQIAEESITLSEQIGEITGRPAFEVMSQEIMPVLEMARYLKYHMPSWLRMHYKHYWVPGFNLTTEHLYFKPLGTVAVILPANFPFSLGMMSAFYLAAAGNTVILKPSEEYPHITEWMQQIIDESGLSDKVFGIVGGGAESVSSLIESGFIKKVFFFGKSTTGIEIKHQCIKQDIPFVLETGGGTAAIIDKDADLIKSASGIAWSAFYTRGHSCIGTRFVFVNNSIKKAFLKHLMIESARVLGEYYKPFTLNDETVKRIKSAVDRGGIFHPVYSEYEQDDNQGEKTFEKPGILDVFIEDPVFKNEIYDPIITICGIDHFNEAVDKITESDYLIGTSVWSKNHVKAKELILQLRTDMNWINDCSFGMPNLPWGSRNATGQGSLFSKSSLLEAGTWKWIIDNHNPKRRFWWHPYNLNKFNLLKKLTRFYR